MLCDLSVHPFLEKDQTLDPNDVNKNYLKSVHYNLIVPGPCCYLTEEMPESLEAYSRFRFLFVTIASRKETRRRSGGWWRRYNAHCTIESVVDQTSLFFIESSETPEIPNGTSFRKRLDAMNDITSELLALREDDIIRQNREFPERN
jgi:hypothetical protein